MERLREKDLLAVLDFLRTVNLARDLDSFRDGVTTGIARLVDCDVVTYYEIDPAGGDVMWITAPAEPAEAADRAAFLRNMAQHPIIRHHRRTGGGEARRVSDFCARRSFQGTALYDEFFRPLGIEAQVAIRFAGPRGVLVGVSLNRDRRDFTARDLVMLDVLRPHLAQAYDTAGIHSRLERAGDGEKAEVIVLSADGRIDDAPATALARLTAWFGDGPRPDRLPAGVADWLDGPSASSPFVIARGAARLELQFLPARSPAENGALVLREHGAGPAAAQLRDLGLTRREAEVLALVTQGATNAEIASALSVSPRTVKKHLEHINGKLGTTTRTAAAAAAHGAVS